MLRIDVSVADGHAAGFVVPADNPFVGVEPAGDLELRLRNPWRWSFDDPGRGGTGALIIADVGQSAREEINYEPAGRGGRNYGWRIREGTIATPGVAPTLASVPAADRSDPRLRPRRAAAASPADSSIAAARCPPFVGRYFFADFVSGRIWSLGLDDQLHHRRSDGLGSAGAHGGTRILQRQHVRHGRERRAVFRELFNGSIYRIESSVPVISVDRPVADVRSGHGRYRRSRHRRRRSGAA